ncbi:hypothetical protein [Flagellimonas sp.]|uniref:hypothetical protein n=1 Tax=Flagellimonas sp. TaxID=2058762 RepID=UPI003F4A23AA
MKNQLLFCLTTFLFAIQLFGQQVYEDPEGKFVMDLYDGLKQLEQQHALVYQFKNDGYSILAQKTEDSDDINAAYAISVNNLSSSGLTNMKPIEDTKEMVVNGNQVITSTYQGDYSAEGIQAKLIGIAYAIVLEEHTLSLVSVLNESNYKKSKDLIEDTLLSIRMPSQEITGITEEEILNLNLEDMIEETEEEVSSEPTNIVYEGIALTLPAGWVNQEKSRSDAENIIGKFKNDKLSASCFIMRLKGIIWNMKTANQVAVDVGKNAMSQSELIRSQEISLGKKKKGYLHEYKGTVINEGKEVPITAITMVHKVKKQFLIYFLSTGSSSLADIEKDLLAIAGSAK